MQIKSLAGAGAIALGLVLVGGTGGAVAGSLIDGGDVRNGTLSGADIRSESITGVDIDNGTLTGYDVRDGSLTGTDIATGTITSSDIASSVYAYIDTRESSVTSIINVVGVTSDAIIDVADYGVVTLTVSTEPGAGDAHVALHHGSTGDVLVECVAVSTDLGGSCSATRTLSAGSYSLRFTGGAAKATITGVKVG